MLSDNETYSDSHADLVFMSSAVENDHGDEENSKVEKSIEIEQEFGNMKEKVTTIIILRR